MKRWDHHQSYTLWCIKFAWIDHKSYLCLKVEKERSVLALRRRNATPDRDWFKHTSRWRSLMVQKGNRPEVQEKHTHIQENPQNLASQIFSTNGVENYNGIGPRMQDHWKEKRDDESSGDSQEIPPRHSKTCAEEKIIPDWCEGYTNAFCIMTNAHSSSYKIGLQEDPDTKVLKGRWVFKTKRDLQGRVKRYKARWVWYGQCSERKW